ncbi:hypothetical protein [Marinifilum fragile]|uniref:hypothetical protein n=1 Tax=Marinifilum fragile TaxID=570161 RepID=UPI002AAB4EAA|nr:hypothetical protein [Marinifilum fragile]
MKTKTRIKEIKEEKSLLLLLYRLGRFGIAGKVASKKFMKKYTSSPSPFSSMRRGSG